MAKEDKKKNEKKDSQKQSFFKGLKAELKRVSWPTFKQVVNNTVAVITIVIVVAVTVFVLDFIFESLNRYGVGSLKALVSSNEENVVDTNTITTESNLVEGALNEVQGETAEGATNEAVPAETTTETPTAENTVQDAQPAEATVETQN